MNTYQSIDNVHQKTPKRVPSNPGNSTTSNPSNPISNPTNPTNIGAVVKFGSIIRNILLIGIFTRDENISKR